MSDTVLVTGANRGIGLEIVRALLADGHRVVATCREPAKGDALRALDTDGRLEILALDVGDGASIEALAGTLRGRTLDALVNNAGRLHRESGVDDIDHDDWALTFAVNSQAPLRVATALKPNLLASSHPRVLAVSSQLGSLERAGVGLISYRSSKAALNMAMRCLAAEWASEGVVVTMVHPGWVRSDMGGSDADLSTAESAADLVALLSRLGAEHNGRFLNHDGAPMPW